MNNNVMYWYGTDESNRPIVTIAVSANSDGTVNRGVAVLGRYDNPDKKYGRRLALSRLKIAENQKMNLLQMNWMFSKIYFTSYADTDVPKWLFKSQYHVMPEEIEKKVLFKEKA